MELLKHLWSIRHEKLYWTGTKIRISLLRYAIVAVVVPSIVWDGLNTRMDSLRDKAKTSEASNTLLVKTNKDLTEQVADLKSRLAKALTVDHPDAKR